jgi:leucyl aminopeptidase (aminopeptidase T)
MSSSKPPKPASPGLPPGATIAPESPRAPRSFRVQTLPPGSSPLEAPRAPSTHPSTHPPSSRPPGREKRPAPLDFALMTPATRVLQELLCLRSGERLVLLHDTTNAALADAFEHAAGETGARVDRLDLEKLAPRPWQAAPSEALQAIRGASATLLAVRLEDGEYAARFAIVQAARLAGARHVHMIGVSSRTFAASMAAPVARVVGLQDALRAAMQPSSKLSARSSAGTRLEVEMAPHLRWDTSGGVVQPGAWINVPYGQILTSPAQVRGVYVCDASMGGPVGARAGSLAQRPIRLTIEDARVKKVECSDRGLQLHVERFLTDGEGHDRVGCINLGANIGIVAAAGEQLHDEHMPGLHISLGDNYRERTGATWTARGQLSFSMAESDVDLDGVPLMRRGRYVRFV